MLLRRLISRLPPLPTQCSDCTASTGGRHGIQPKAPAWKGCRILAAKTTDPLDDYIDAVAKALALPVEDAWKPAVKANLEVSLRLARLVDEFALPDEAEPASVFAA